MIKQSTVLMATPIAMLATEKGLNLHEKASDIIKGLNETTASIVSFTEDNVATELPDYTGLVPDHTETMEMVTTIVADTIRAALGVISKTIKPILVETQDKLKDNLSSAGVVDTIYSNLSIDMINIEPSFLNSAFYPKAPVGAFTNVKEVRLDELLMGSYPRMSGQELQELISVDNSDLAAFFESPSEIEDIYSSLFVEKNFYTIFNSDAINNGVASVGNATNYRFGSFRTLVIATLILTKLVSMDDPLDGVTSVSLDDYRSSLKVTRDLLSTMLFYFRQIWESRAAAGIVIIDNEVKYGVSDYSSASTAEVPMFQGKLVIGYNKAVLQMFAGNNELSLSEYVIGSLYAKQRGYQIKDIITDINVISSAWIEYRGDVASSLVTNKGAMARKIFTQVVESLYAKEEYKSMIDLMEEDYPPSQRILQRLSKHIDLNLFFNNITMLDAVLRGDNSLMNTQLAAKLADVFDCPIAEEILTLNANSPAGTIEQQRKALSRSIDKVIIKRLFTI